MAAEHITYRKEGANQFVLTCKDCQHDIGTIKSPDGTERAVYHLAFGPALAHTCQAMS